MKKKSGKRFKERSLRNQKWNYGWNAYYSVTICTHKKIPYFGSIKNIIPQFSDIGIIADTIWKEIPKRFPYAILDEYIIMPNHMHGIILINNIDRNAINRVPSSDIQNNVGGFAGDRNPMINNNLSRIIRWYKGRVTYESRMINPDFKWQALFHDQIIHDQQHLDITRKYIIDNPKNYHH